MTPSTQSDVKWLFYKLTELNLNQYAGGVAQPGLSVERLKDLSIGLPPLNIQQQIVAQCEAMDKAVEVARGEIFKNQNSLMYLLTSHGQAKQAKLEQVAKRVSKNIDPQQLTGQVNYIGLENIEAHTGLKVGVTLTDYASIKSAKTKFQTGDLLYGKLRPNLNKVHLAQDDGICSTDIYVLRFASLDLTRIYAHWLRGENFNVQVLATVSGQQLPRTSWSAMGQIGVPVFTASDQSKLIPAIELIEKSTVTAQATIAAAPALKQAILQKYL